MVIICNASLHLPSAFINKAQRTLEVFARQKEEKGGCDLFRYLKCQSESISQPDQFGKHQTMSSNNTEKLAGFLFLQNQNSGCFSIT